MKVDRSFKKLSNVLPYLLAFVDNERRYKFVNTAYEGFFGVKLKTLKVRVLPRLLGKSLMEKFRAS